MTTRFFSVTLLEWLIAKNQRKISDSRYDKLDRKGFSMCVRIWDYQKTYGRIYYAMYFGSSKTPFNCNNSKFYYSSFIIHSITQTLVYIIPVLYVCSLFEIQVVCLEYPRDDYETPNNSFQKVSIRISKFCKKNYVFDYSKLLNMTDHVAWIGYQALSEDRS